MKIGLVLDESKKYDGYSWHEVYAKEFQSLGDETFFLDFKRSDWFQQIKLNKPDFIVWRAWHVPDDRDDARIKIKLIEKLLRIPIFPDGNMYSYYDNKIMQHTFLKESGFPIPDTWIFRKKEEALEFAEEAKFPLVSKCSEGACGDNVQLIQNKKELKEYIRKAFSKSGIKTYFPWINQKGYVYLQEFIHSDKDIRIITIGDKVELAFWRENKNSWKHNIAGGGKIILGNIPGEAKNLALEISKRLGYPWCAFDIILKENRPLVLEFSSMFGFSKSGNYKKYFGSPNAFVLKKQTKYLHNLFAK